MKIKKFIVLVIMICFLFVILAGCALNEKNTEDTAMVLDNGTELSYEEVEKLNDLEDDANIIIAKVLDSDVKDYISSGELEKLDAEELDKIIDELKVLLKNEFGEDYEKLIFTSEKNETIPDLYKANYSTYYYPLYTCNVTLLQERGPWWAVNKSSVFIYNCNPDFVLREVYLTIYDNMTPYGFRNKLYPNNSILCMWYPLRELRGSVNGHTKWGFFPKILGEVQVKLNMQYFNPILQNVNHYYYGALKY